MALLPTTASTSLGEMVTAANTSFTTLLPTGAQTFLYIIMGVFVGFFVVNFIWHFLKKDQQSG